MERIYSGETYPRRVTTRIIDYVDSDGDLHTDVTARIVMVTSESDLAELPGIYAPGSEAYTADGTGQWRLDATGTWNSLVPADDATPSDETPPAEEGT